MKKLLLFLFLLPSVLLAQDLSGKIAAKDAYKRGLITNTDKRNGGWVPIATNPNPLHSSSTAALSGQTFRTAHIAVEDATEIRLVYANWRTIGYGEAPNTNQINVGASIQKMGATVDDQTQPRILAYFNGRLKAALDGSALLYSDPIPVQLTKGERFYINSYLNALLPAAPATPVLSTTTTGGSLPASGTYQVCTAYVYPNDIVSKPSSATSVTTGTGSANIITVAAPAATGGAIGWRAYITPVGSTTAANFYQIGSINDLSSNQVITNQPSTSSLYVTQTLVLPGGGSTMGGTNSSTESLNTGEGWIAGDYTTDGAGTITARASTGVYSPVLILGKTKKPAKTVANNGDSIPSGTGDSGMPTSKGGFVERAVTNQMALGYDITIPPLYAYAYVSQGSETAAIYTNPQQSKLRQTVSGWCANIIDNYGTNDLGSSLATMKANCLILAKRATDRAQKYFKTTLFPKTTSTDAWQTAGNQTVTGSESTRVAFNDWIRDTTSVNGFKYQANAQATAETKGLIEIIDVCKYTEVDASNTLTINGGRFRATGVGTLDSGTGTGVGTSNVVTSGKTWTQNQWKGYSVLFTSGAAAGQIRGIQYNSATTLYFTTPTSPSHAVGDSYIITSGGMQDGTHFLSQGHIWGAQAVQEVLYKLQY